MKGQAGAGAGVIGIAISAILVFSVTVPLIKDAVAGVTANLTATEKTVAGLISLFVILGLMVGSARLFGLI